MDSDSHIYGLLGRIHVLMRRTLNRITDVEYMRINAEYAREILRIAETAGNGELHELCDKLRVAMELEPRAVPARREEKGLSFGLGSKKESPPEDDDARYIGSLR